jgi:hypothetical protein
MVFFRMAASKSAFPPSSSTQPLDSSSVPPLSARSALQFQTVLSPFRLASGHGSRNTDHGPRLRSNAASASPFPTARCPVLLTPPKSHAAPTLPVCKNRALRTRSESTFAQLLIALGFNPFRNNAYEKFGEGPRRSSPKVCQLVTSQSSPRRPTHEHPLTPVLSAIYFTTLWIREWLKQFPSSPRLPCKNRSANAPAICSGSPHPSRGDS